MCVCVCVCVCVCSFPELSSLVFPIPCASLNLKFWREGAVSFYTHQILPKMSYISSILGISFLRQMNLERLISCRLNPLKVSTSLFAGGLHLSALHHLQVCLSTVVEMFASLTRQVLTIHASYPPLILSLFGSFLCLTTSHQLVVL